MTRNKKSVYFWLRLINDMTQEDVAEQLLISLSYVRAIEAGVKKPSKRLLRAYSKLFKADEDVITEFDEVDENVSTKQFLFELLTAMGRSEDDGV